MSPFKVILFFITAALAGLALMPRLSLDLQPDTRLPKLTLTATLPDAPPEVVEQEVTAPLENALAQLSQIKSLYSVSHYGQSTIEIAFDRHADMAFKKFEVTSLVRRLYPRLHAQVSYPEIQQRSRETSGKNALLVYTLSARLSPFQIRQLAADNLVPDIARMPGIQQVSLYGAQPLQLTLAYSMEHLRHYGIQPQQITTLLQNYATTQYPGTLIQGAGERITLQTDNRLFTLNQLEELPVPLPGGQSQPLKKFVRPYLEEQTPVQYYRINGRNAITLSIYADDGVNRLALGREIKNTLRSLAANLPEGIQLTPELDDTEFLAREIDKNMQRALLSAGILILFILLSYRSLPYLAILFSGILVSLGLTALVAWVLNISVHLYTIAGITISFGLLLDNAIVVMDHQFRKGNTKIVRAVMGATLTTMMALLLVLFLPEEERLNLTDFSIIVAVALGSSVLTALFYTPAAFSQFRLESRYAQQLTYPKKKRRVRWLGYYSTLIRLLTRYRKLTVALAVLGFGLPLFMLPTKWEGQTWYNQTIGSELYQEKLRPYVDRLTGGALRLFVLRVYERSGYRSPERTQLYVYAQLPHGNTLNDMNRIMQGMEHYLEGTEGIDRYVTQVYSGEQALMTISFKKEYERSALPYILKSRLIARSLDWGGVTWSIYGVGQGFSNYAGDNLPSFRVKMKGYNYAELEHQAEVLANKLLAHKRIQQVNTNERLDWQEKATDQFVLQVDAAAAGSAGTSPAQLLQALYTSSARSQPDLHLPLNNSLVPVFFVPEKEGNPSLYQLTEQYWFVSDSLRIKPGIVAKLTKQKTASAIHKEDRQYIRVVGFEYYGSEKFGRQYLNEKLEEMKQEMPIGYSAEYLTWSWNWQKTKRQYSLLLVLLTGIFVLCAILFESLRQPFYIILTVPLSFIGLFLTFAWGDFYFDQGGYAAFVLLGGLVVNAGIFIVNDQNNSTCRNYNRAVLKAVTGKLKPVLLTVLSTCLGLIPFLAGGQSEVFWFALAAGTIGGLLFSVLVTMVILPVLMSRKQPA
jgi:multidrug efflux pump subunit AcrB